MKKIYVTFGGSMYDETTQRIVEDAPKLGVDEVRVYDDKWLTEQPFFEQNQWIFRKLSKGQHRGFGWYSWKPFVILQAIESVERVELSNPVWTDSRSPDAPIILWTDADTYPIGDLTPLFEQCHKDGGIMLFAAEGCAQGAWTERDCMIAMGADELTANPNYRTWPHATARFALFECGNWRTKQFLMEWLTYCLNPLCVGLEPSMLAPEYPEFNEHRSDQSILANLAHKYAIPLYREADQFGDGTDRNRDLYGTVFHQIGQYDKLRNLNGSRYRNV